MYKMKSKINLCARMCEELVSITHHCVWCSRGCWRATQPGRAPPSPGSDAPRPRRPTDPSRRPSGRRAGWARLRAAEAAPGCRCLRPRISMRRRMETDEQGCVAAWWDMVARNLRSFPHSCSTLGRKIATLHDSFTSKSLKEHIFPPLMDMLIFFNFFKAPFLVDLKKPELKIPHTANFYIQAEPGVILGIWHTVPSCRGEDAKGKSRCWYEAALRDGNPIIVYLHGSAQHRAASHRLELVKVLSDGGFHVLSVDYRGFGDSTGKPTEEGLTADAICVYEWTKARSGTTPVCLWGHSLGTGVATNAAKVLEEKGFPVDAIILEAPFTNVWVATINYPLLKIYRKLPGFLHEVMDALRRDKIVFPNDENVKFLSSPLLIIHGENDKTVPLECGKKLYEIAHNAYRNKERVKMVIFPPGFQHNFLCKSPILLKTVRDFLSQQWA
ncbi:protein ABHD12B isoform X1 [Sus scrofa]|uniref:protein ABHD12B isoform X1 n=1 Tax=Sus scrofa TaxID=9823 RepID=UPI0006B14A8D|nr:protein ABHD12B isoform X1 [Sus scrofa]